MERMSINLEGAEATMAYKGLALVGRTFREIQLDRGLLDDIQKEIVAIADKAERENVVAARHYPERAIEVAGPWIAGMKITPRMVQRSINIMMGELKELISLGRLEKTP